MGNMRKISISQRFRLAVLGSPNSGKSSLIRRILTGRFIPKNRAAGGESVYSRDFYLPEHQLMVPCDMYDINEKDERSQQFMMMTADAFLVAFAMDDEKSFQKVRENTFFYQKNPKLHGFCSYL